MSGAASELGLRASCCNCCRSFKKCDVEIKTSPLDKLRMGNAKNLINAAAFNRINRHVEPFLSHGVIFCLVPRPHYYAWPMRFGSRGPRKFVSDTSPKCIDREGLKRRRM